MGLSSCNAKEETMKITLVHGQNRKGSSYNIGRLFADKIAGDNDIKEFFFTERFRRDFLSRLLSMY